MKKDGDDDHDCDWHADEERPVVGVQPLDGAFLLPLGLVGILHRHVGISFPRHEAAEEH